MAVRSGRLSLSSFSSKCAGRVADGHALGSRTASLIPEIRLHNVGPNVRRRILVTGVDGHILWPRRIRPTMKDSYQAETVLPPRPTRGTYLRVSELAQYRVDCKPTLTAALPAWSEWPRAGWQGHRLGQGGYPPATSMPPGRARPRASSRGGWVDSWQRQTMVWADSRKATPRSPDALDSNPDGARERAHTSPPRPRPCARPTGFGGPPRSARPRPGAHPQGSLRARPARSGSHCAPAAARSPRRSRNDWFHGRSPPLLPTSAVRPQVHSEGDLSAMTPTQTPHFAPGLHRVLRSQRLGARST